MVSEKGEGEEEGIEAFRAKGFMPLSLVKILILQGRTDLLSENSSH